MLHSGGQYGYRNTFAEVSGGDTTTGAKTYEFEASREIADQNLMPQTQTGDAVHLAYASYYKMDFLLTWNCSHLANANKKDHIRRINAMMNLPTPEIITPLELFREGKNERSIDSR